MNEFFALFFLQIRDERLGCVDVVMGMGANALGECMGCHAWVDRSVDFC